MPLITGNDLIEAGYPSGPIIGEMLKAAAGIEAKGITDPKYIIKLLMRDFSPPPPKMEMRVAPAAFSEAIEAMNAEEEKNVASVRRYMRELMKVPVIRSGAVMPDACPAGSAPGTIPVGGAIAVENAIIPSAHSADICCSMHASFFECDREIGAQLDALMESTRFGAGGRREDDLVHHAVLDENVWDNPFLKGLERHAAIHMADQGDGNHFAYIGEITVRAGAAAALREAGYGAIAGALLPGGEIERKLRVLVTHHGSRGLGAQVYKRGQKSAVTETGKIAQGIPKAAAWLDYASVKGAAYWEALQYVGRWTKANHESIHARFLERIGSDAVTAFGNEHNFVWKRGDVFLHGKGATPAWKDSEEKPLLGLIPLNMAAPILVVLGKDNPEFLSFAPHGAGRNLSRTAMMKPFRGKDGAFDEERVARKIAETTSEIAVRWYHGKADLSETPSAYKNADQVKDQIRQFGLADVVAEIEPLGCIMAGQSDGPPFWKREKPLTPKQKRQIEHRADRRKEHERLSRGDWGGEE